MLPLSGHLLAHLIYQEVMKPSLLEDMFSLRPRVPAQQCRGLVQAPGRRQIAASTPHNSSSVELRIPDEKTWHPWGIKETIN